MSVGFTLTETLLTNPLCLCQGERGVPGLPGDHGEKGEPGESLTGLPVSMMLDCLVSVSHIHNLNYVNFKFLSLCPEREISSLNMRIGVH